MKRRWDRIMEDIKSGVNDAKLKKRYGLSGDVLAVYRKYAKYARFDADGGYVGYASAETASAMASLNQFLDALSPGIG